MHNSTGNSDSEMSHIHGSDSQWPGNCTYTLNKMSVYCTCTCDIPLLFNE